MRKRSKPDVEQPSPEGSDGSLAAGPRVDPGSRVAGGHNLVFGLDGIETEEREPESSPARPRGRRRRWPRRLVWTALLLAALALVPELYLHASTASHRHSTATAPAVAIAMVIDPYNQHEATNRSELMAVAEDLKRQRLVRQIVEVVPGTTSSPYEACLRARRERGIEAVLIITDTKELDDAVYSCRHLGIDASGVGLGPRGRLFSTTEAVHSMKTLWNVYITRPGRPAVID